MKYLVIVSLAILAFGAFSVSAQSHNITWGSIRANDTLLDQEIVVLKYKFLQIVSEDFTYPRKGYYNGYNITGIRCTDQYTNGDGGSATLLKGGPGKTDVTIHLKSKRNHGFNFIIQIYGR